MWRTLRPSAGQAQQWVSEWVHLFGTLLKRVENCFCGCHFSRAIFNSLIISHKSCKALKLTILVNTVKNATWPYGGTPGSNRPNPYICESFHRTDLQSSLTRSNGFPRGPTSDPSACLGLAFGDPWEYNQQNVRCSVWPQSLCTIAAKYVWQFHRRSKILQLVVKDPEKIFDLLLSVLLKVGTVTES